MTLYELLTLRPAFAGDDRVEILRRIAKEEPTPPRKLDPTIPVDLETIVLKAMAKAPDGPIRHGRRYGCRSRPVPRQPSHRRPPAQPGGPEREVDATPSSADRDRGGGAGLARHGLAGAVLHYAAWLRRHNAALQAEVDRADRYAAEAQRHASEADRQRKLADRHFLAAQLRLAQQAIERVSSKSPRTCSTRSRLILGDGATGDFAWQYLRRLARRELVQLPERPRSLGNGRGRRWKDRRSLVQRRHDRRCGTSRPSTPLRTIGPVKCRNLVLSEDGRILAAEQGSIGRRPLRSDHRLGHDDRPRPGSIRQDPRPAGGRRGSISSPAAGCLLADSSTPTRTTRCESQTRVRFRQAPGPPGASLDGLDSRSCRRERISLSRARELD